MGHKTQVVREFIAGSATDIVMMKFIPFFFLCTITTKKFSKPKQHKKM